MIDSLSPSPRCSQDVTRAAAPSLSPEPTAATGPISWADWARAVLRLTPELPRLLPGLVRLAWLRPQQLGSIGRTFEVRASRHPQRIALRFEDRSWTYGELNAWANRVAHSLKRSGLRSGQAVGILMENRPEVIAFALGIVKLGGIATLLNHHLRDEAQAHSLRLSRPRIVLVGQECEAVVRSLPQATLAELDIDWWWDGQAPPPDGWPHLQHACAQAPDTNLPETAAIALSQPCFHIFTSGSTGLPKASVMSHYRWHRCMLGMGELGLRLRQDDVLYCALPLHHNNALTVSWGATVGAGACLALGRKFSASGFWQDIRRHRATAFSYIGELCRYLLNQAPRADDAQHGVRAIIGNGLRPDIWGAFQQRFAIEHIAEFYAASECNLAFVNALNLPGSAGMCPLSHAIVAFDVAEETPVREGPQGLMRRVEKGQVGLLLTEITDKAPMDGYTDERATASKVLRDVLRRGDAWFNSGDLVRDQGFGHIQFIDRVGDTFRWKGENVATTEVEAALCAQAGIEEAVVYGVQLPNTDGRAGMAALLLSGEATDLDGAGLMQGLRQALPRYAVPLFLRLRRQHELTSTFKHRKVELKREGFLPNDAGEPIWVLSPQGYVPLSADAQAAIEAGHFKFE
ncbi:long-chain-acyl-CoA synthetase [Aquabacterium sp. UBA2148]|uniref:long-chain-acyl-CoA synthetase n=1 Tax=Aquabacterium sp. UBA2148 TaxID=1946042 RepID=UPI00257B7AD8|nr:long-chain-acyl-CoA synthetase [Aquabacterium sp. UBA2148]